MLALCLVQIVPASAPVELVSVNSRWIPERSAEIFMMENAKSGVMGFPEGFISNTALKNESIHPIDNILRGHYVVIQRDKGLWCSQWACDAPFFLWHAFTEFVGSWDARQYLSQGADAYPRPYDGIFGGLRPGVSVKNFYRKDPVKGNFGIDSDRRYREPRAVAQQRIVVFPLNKRVSIGGQSVSRISEPSCKANKKQVEDNPAFLQWRASSNGRSPILGISVLLLGYVSACMCLRGNITGWRIGAAAALVVIAWLIVGVLWGVFG